MTDRKKITNKIQLAILVFFIVFMPLGSWYYLQLGFSYHEKLMSELKDYGKLPEFVLLTQDNDTVTNSDLHGKIIVANFYNNEKPTTKAATDYARRILGQFKSQKDLNFLFYSLTPNLEDANSLANIAKKEELEEKRAYFLTGDNDQMTRLLIANFKIPLLDERAEDGTISFESNVNSLPEEYPYFALIDSSLTIRNYYNINDKTSMNKLVEHLAIILPREKKSKAVLKPETEK